MTEYGLIDYLGGLFVGAGLIDYLFNKSEILYMWRTKHLDIKKEELDNMLKFKPESLPNATT